MAEEGAKKRLGRGLAALIGEIEATPANLNVANEAEPIKSDGTVPIEWVRANPNNPRRIFLDSELEDLKNSISQHGIVQPILVRSVKGDDLAGARYEIIAGERRWRAAQKAGQHEVPIVIREVEDRQALEIAIIENVQRADLNPVEEGVGYQQLMEEYDYSQNELAAVIGKSRSHVANTIRLLKLPKAVQAMLSSGDLSAGHARTLVTANDPETLAKQIVDQGLSVRQAEAMAQSSGGIQNSRAAKGSGVKADKNADIIALEKRLADALGLRVAVSFKADASGEVKIAYRNLEQLDEVCRRLENPA